MRDLALLEFLTMDGVMQSPGGPDEDCSGGFTRGGWAQPCWEGVMAQVAVEAMAEPYDLLLGRTTYDTFAGSFAGAPSDDPAAQRLNEAHKFVVTSSHEALDWGPAEAISGDIIAGVQEAKARRGPLLQVHGSWELTQALLAHDLVDELRLWTFPVVVGEGKRLFGDGVVPGAWHRTRSGETEEGATMGIYRRR